MFKKKGFFPPGKIKMSLSFARTWSKIYFAFEIIWMILWATALFVYLGALEKEGSFYRLIGTLNAFHLLLMPCVEYVLQDGDKRIIVGFLATIVTDVAIVWDIGAHAPSEAREVGWAFILSLVVSGLGLFITTFIALLWLLYVWYHNIKFRVKGTTEEKPDESGAKIRFRIK
jgi:hypothetical protein